MHAPSSVAACVLLAAVLTTGTPCAAAEGCAVAITAPEEGEKVGAQTLIRGTADIPPDSHLWVLVGIEGLDGWWPQGNGAARILDREWKVLAYIGGEQDIGRTFDIAAAVVNDDAHHRLEMWFKDAATTGRYDPIKFPSTEAGCPPRTVTVAKSSH